MEVLRSILHACRAAFPPPHREATPFLLIGALVAIAGLVWHAAALFWLGLALAGFCLFFFRDPERVPAADPALLLAPADGTVVSVGRAVPPAELGLPDAPMLRIAIFLSVLNVHVNRMPAAGTVVAVSRRPGRFLSASLDKASEENERVALSLRLADGAMAAVVQIAGLIARRIVCEAEPGASFASGARYGIIRFGSRTDLYLPDDAVALVRVGQTMIGGETAVARRGSAPAVAGPVAAEFVAAEPVAAGSVAAGSAA